MTPDSTKPHDAETDLDAFEVFEVGIFDCITRGRTRRRWLGVVRDEAAADRVAKGLGRPTEWVLIHVLPGYPIDGVTEAGEIVPHPDR